MNFMSIGSQKDCQPESLKSITDHHFLILCHEVFGPETKGSKLNGNEYLLVTGAKELCDFLGKAFLQTVAGKLILLART